MSNYIGSGWFWFLWVGVIFLIFSSMGNWGYTYQAHRRFEDIHPKKSALDILNERYARGEIRQDEYGRIRSDLLDQGHESFKRRA